MLRAVRRITAADIDLVEDLHQRCSPEHLLRRWGRTRITRRDVQRLLERTDCSLGLDAHDNPLGLVCVGPVSREAGVVDLALQVADTYQRQGIGTALAREAADRARRRGAHTLTAYTQASNTPMLQLLGRLGPARHIRDGPYVEVRVHLDARPDAPTRKPPPT